MPYPRRVFYYLIASLPRPVFDGPPPLSLDNFHALCLREAGAEIAERIRAIRLYSDDLRENEEHARGWYDWEKDLRNELVLRRANEQGVAAGPFLRNYRPHSRAALVVRGIPDEIGPAELRDILDRARWRRLDELEFGRHFDLTLLIIYALRLRILEARARFQDGAGLTRLRGFMSHAVEQTHLALERGA